MISRRNYFTITLIMLVLLFLFQAPEVIKERMYDYDSNKYASDAQISGLDRDSVVTAQKEDVKTSGRYIVYIGDIHDQQSGGAVASWCAYSKRYVEAYKRIGQCRVLKHPAREPMPEAVVIDAAYIDVKKDTKSLERLAEQGITMIFCGLPNLQRLKESRRLQNLMGIRAILSDEVQVQGIHLFDGLLLGGEKIYRLDDTMEPSKQDLELKMPWCQTAAGTKTYMAGMMEQPVKNEQFPAIIWRNSFRRAKIFVVNGNYISGNAGIGFLEAMLYETRSYAVYPVINAQNLVILNYPALASENEEAMKRIYSRSLDAVYRDLVWPGLSLTAEKNKKKLTCMLSPQQDYTDNACPDPNDLIFYMKLLQERQGEAGISGSYKKADGFIEKLNQDQMFLKQEIPDYKFLCFYPAGLSDDEIRQAFKHPLLEHVRTIFVDYDRSKALVSYQNEKVTRQCATNEGWRDQTFSENLRLGSIQTALGYSCVAVDCNQIADPQSEEDTWEKLYDKFASGFSTCWKAFQGFSATTLAESDTRIRRFLALDYTEQKTGREILLSMDHFEQEAFFILRLQREHINTIQGAEYRQLQEGVWLIEANRDTVRITLEKEPEPVYYE